MAGIKAGYIGIYNGQCMGDASVYIAHDDICQTAVTVLLTPGSYHTAMAFLTNVSIQNVYLLTPTLNDLMRADILRIMLDLAPLKKNIRLIFPEPREFDVGNVQGYLRRQHIVKKQFQFSNAHGNPMDLSVSYELFPGGEQPMTYAINLLSPIGLQTFITYIPNHSSLAQIVMSDKERPRRYIHFPFLRPAFGGKSAWVYFSQKGVEEPANRMAYEALQKRIVVYGFRCPEEFHKAETNLDRFLIPNRLILMP